MGRPNYYSLFVLIFSVFVSCEDRQEGGDTLQIGNASDVGLMEERLQNIDIMLQDYVEKNKLPGAVALVVRKGKIVKQLAVGYKNIEEKRPYETGDF
jgi:hypothetical protein